MTKDRPENYPYDIADKLIEEIYPDESKDGGVIEFVDVGELHYLLGKFYERIKDDQR